MSVHLHSLLSIIFTHHIFIVFSFSSEDIRHKADELSPAYLVAINELTPHCFYFEIGKSLLLKVLPLSYMYVYCSTTGAYFSDILKHDERGAMLMMLAPVEATYKPSHPAILVHDTNFPDPSLPIYSQNPQFTENVVGKVKAVVSGKSTYEAEFGKIPNVVDVKKAQTVGIGVVFPDHGSEVAVYYTVNGKNCKPIITDFKKASQKVGMH